MPILLKCSSRELETQGVERAACRLPTLGCNDWSELDAVTPNELAALRRAYVTAAPFPHLVLDDLFDTEMLAAIERGFADVSPEQWAESRHGLQRKRGTVPSVCLPPVAAAYFHNLHGEPMRRFLSAMTGIDDLQGDPTLVNGGLHQVPTGGRFELHVDFARHPVTRLTNRLVLITYLNPGWSADDGGALELWSWRPRRAAITILPIMGRTVLINVGPKAIHGHPDPVRAAEGRARRSLAAYFYTGAPGGSEPAGATITGYMDRPGAPPIQRAIRFAYSTLPDALAGKARTLFRR